FDNTNGGTPRIHLEGRALDDERLMVNGIEIRLAQVFRNLFTNAVSFSGPQDCITITVSRKDVWMTVLVDDEGPGLPKGKEDAIFDRFYTDRRDSEKFGTHSGLGLSILRQIINAHGGQLTASNRMDADGNILGARFTVHLSTG
ncbi:MAG TPA: ATP-binding protein, partial [Rhodospirillales bacterium]|nr:ATP-binding protein [Rhodospirillales bacterium]